MRVGVQLIHDELIPVAGHKFDAGIDVADDDAGMLDPDLDDDGHDLDPDTVH